MRHNPTSKELLELIAQLQAGLIAECEFLLSMQLTDEHEQNLALFCTCSSAPAYTIDQWMSEYADWKGE